MPALMLKGELCLLCCKRLTKKCNGTIKPCLPPFRAGPAKKFLMATSPTKAFLVPGIGSFFGLDPARTWLENCCLSNQYSITCTLFSTSPGITF